MMLGALLVGNIDENNNFVIKSNVKEVIGKRLNLLRVGSNCNLLLKCEYQLKCSGNDC